MEEQRIFEPDGAELNESLPDRSLSLAMRYHEHVPGASLESLHAIMAMALADSHIIQISNRLLATLDPEVNLTRYSFLRALYFAPGYRLALNEAAKRTFVTAGNITYLVKILRDNGLVERKSSPLDGRIQYAELTERGRELSARLVAGLGELMSGLCDQLTNREQAQLSRLVGKVYQRALAENSQQRERPAGQKPIVRRRVLRASKRL